MKINARKILKELIEDFGISKELIASKLQVHSRTIERWLDGKYKPRPIYAHYLKRIYNGYISQRGKDEKNT